MEQSAVKPMAADSDSRGEKSIEPDAEFAAKLLSHPPLVHVASKTAPDLKTKASRRRQRLRAFIKLELTALALLIALLFAATSSQSARVGLSLSLKIAAAAAALTVALIPVIFYGPTRQKYRYRRYRKSA